MVGAPKILNHHIYHFQTLLSSSYEEEEATKWADNNSDFSNSKKYTDWLAPENFTYIWIWRVYLAQFKADMGSCQLLFCFVKSWNTFVQL